MVFQISKLTNVEQEYSLILVIVGHLQLSFEALALSYAVRSVPGYIYVSEGDEGKRIYGTCLKDVLLV